MFWPDVIDLKQFYATPAGGLALQSLSRCLRRIWPSLRGESVLGIGFCPPLLGNLAEEADTAFACMPAQQGVIHWPAGGKNRTFLSYESELPLPDNSVSRVIVVHALENTERVREFMQEIWRVLTPTGRVLIIVPNRLGIWARSPKSPFAHGHPYTAQQLHNLMFDHSLTPLRTEKAIFFWPAQSPLMLKIARFMETSGHVLWPRFAGTIIMEAEKQIYAPTGGVRARAPARRIPVPATEPKPVLGRIPTIR